MNTSKIHINNMYIKYTFVHIAILLIRQVFGVATLLSGSWIWGYPALPACGPPRGSIDSLVRPSFGINNSRPLRGAKPREVDDAKTPEEISLLRLARKGRRVLCKVYLTMLSWREP